MGDQAIHQTFRSQTLRISFREFFYVLFVVTLVLVNGYLFLMIGVRSPWIYLFPVPIFVATAWAVALLILRNRFPIRLEPEGLHCCDWLCKYETVSWESITSAKVVSMMGLTYLRIVSAEAKRPLWLPLNIDHGDKLDALLAGYVDESHPLLAPLSNHR